MPDLADLAPGEVGGFLVAGAGCWLVGSAQQLYAYRDHCPACDDSLAGAALHRRPRPHEPVLDVPVVDAHFDVVHAGARLDDGAVGHLDPVPLLFRDGVLSIAVPAEPMGAAA